jgi:hypothetical protein
MAIFYLPTNNARDDNFKSALPNYVYLPYNMGRSIPRQQDHQSPFITPPSNSIDLAKWINYQIDEGVIIIPSGAADGNGIYSGNGTIPDNTIARLGTSFGIEPTGTSNEYNLYLTPTSSQLGVGTGSSTYSYRLTLTETTATFTDDISSGGLKYASDYSAQFVPLSLVTKQYVDANMGGDGIYGGSGTIFAGGIATLPLNSNFTMRYNGGTYGFRMLESANKKTTLIGAANFSLVLNDTTDTAVFTDFGTNKHGLQYAANYSATYTARSLVDRGYIDQVLDGRKWKQSVLVSTTTNITLSGEQTIDGVLTSTSRVLVKDQTSQIENGIYTSGAGAWVRTTDNDTGPEIVAAAVSVEQGTIGANEQWFQITDPVTLGSSNIIWVPIGSGVYTADGEGIEVFANEFSLELDGTTLSKSATGVKVADSGITGTQINVSVAGDGLIGGGGSPLAVGAGTGVTVTANAVSVTNALGSPWTIANKKSGQFIVVTAGAFSTPISVSPYTQSDVMVQLRDVDDKIIIADIDTTISGGNITIAGIAPTNNYVINYVIIA